MDYGLKGRNAIVTASGGSEYEEDEAGRLREEIEMLRQQLDGAMERLDKLATG